MPRTGRHLRGVGGTDKIKSKKNLFCSQSLKTRRFQTKPERPRSEPRNAVLETGEALS